MSEHMSKKEKEKKEKIVKGMKKGDGKKFEKRYPGRGKEVMYATATKQAMEEDVVAYYKNILVEYIFRENDPRLRDGSHEIDPDGKIGSGKIISKEELARRYEEESKSPRRVGGKLSSPEEIAQYREQMGKRWKEGADEFKQREEMRKKAKEELDPNFVGPPSPETQEYVESQKNPLRATLPPLNPRRVGGNVFADSPDVVLAKYKADEERRKKAKEELDPNFVGPPSPETQEYVENEKNLEKLKNLDKFLIWRDERPPTMPGYGGNRWGPTPDSSRRDRAREELDPNFVGPPSPETQEHLRRKKRWEMMQRDQTLPSYGSVPSGNSKPSGNSNRIFPFKDPRKMKK